ncbi:MAG TPA: hypothetical protein VN950_02725, partial [Terriglobales bacterium]|nr:hypothetical protein [Terriglobales bacterium]
RVGFNDDYYVECGGETATRHRMGRRPSTFATRQVDSPDPDTFARQRQSGVRAKPSKTLRSVSNPTSPGRK